MKEEELLNVLASRVREALSPAQQSKVAAIETELEAEYFEALRIHLQNHLTRDDVEDVTRFFTARGLSDPIPARLALYIAVVESICRPEGIDIEMRSKLPELREILFLIPAQTVSADRFLEQFDRLFRLGAGEEMPGIEVDLPLQRGEIAYFVFEDVDFHRESSIPDDSGTLTLTSKRLVFTGQFKAFALRLTKVLKITEYKNAVVILRDSQAANNVPWGFHDRHPDLLYRALHLLRERAI